MMDGFYKQVCSVYPTPNQCCKFCGIGHSLQNIAQRLNTVAKNDITDLIDVCIWLRLPQSH